MIAILTLIYVGLIWLLFFKLKLIEPNAKSYTAAAIVGVVVVGAILLAVNVPQMEQVTVLLYDHSTIDVMELALTTGFAVRVVGPGYAAGGVHELGHAGGAGRS